MDYPWDEDDLCLILMWKGQVYCSHVCKWFLGSNMFPFPPCMTTKEKGCRGILVNIARSTSCIKLLLHRGVTIFCQTLLRGGSRIFWKGGWEFLSWLRNTQKIRFFRYRPWRQRSTVFRGHSDLPRPGLILYLFILIHFFLVLLFWILRTCRAHFNCIHYISFLLNISIGEVNIHCAIRRYHIPKIYKVNCRTTWAPN
jgi:hypothetical protein